MHILQCVTAVNTTATTVTLSATVTNFIYNATFVKDVVNGHYFKHKIPIPYPYEGVAVFPYTETEITSISGHDSR